MTTASLLALAAILLWTTVVVVVVGRREWTQAQAEGRDPAWARAAGPVLGGFLEAHWDDLVVAAVAAAAFALAA